MAARRIRRCSSQTETPKRYRYTGKERDEETGLYYHGARYYAPWLGRWTSCDPAGLVDGLNLYVYAGANPVVRHDPSGLYGLEEANEDLARANRIISIMFPPAAIANGVANTLRDVAGHTRALVETESTGERVEAAKAVIEDFAPYSLLLRLGRLADPSVSGINAVAVADPTGVVSKTMQAIEEGKRAAAAQREPTDTGTKVRSGIDLGLAVLECADAAAQVVVAIAGFRTAGPVEAPPVRGQAQVRSTTVAQPPTLRPQAVTEPMPMAETPTLHGQTIAEPMPITEAPTLRGQTFTERIPLEGAPTERMSAPEAPQSARPVAVAAEPGPPPPSPPSGGRLPGQLNPVQMIQWTQAELIGLYAMYARMLRTFGK